MQTPNYQRYTILQYVVQTSGYIQVFPEHLAPTSLAREE